MDSKEFELPETIFSWDIENRVFQSIALQCLARIEGVALLEGNLIDSLLGRDCGDRVKGIHVDQEEKKHAVSVRVEINIAYGVCIPEKAEEIQHKISQEISRLTGLRVSGVHVIFKNLLPAPQTEETKDLALCD